MIIPDNLMYKIVAFLKKQTIGDAYGLYSEVVLAVSQSETSTTIQKTQPIKESK